MDSRTVRSWAWGIFQVALMLTVIGIVIDGIYHLVQWRAANWHGRRGL